LENAVLEELRFNGIYEKMIELVTGRKQECFVGMR